MFLVQGNCYSQGNLYSVGKSMHVSMKVIVFTTSICGKERPRGGVLRIDEIERGYV